MLKLDKGVHSHGLSHTHHDYVTGTLHAFLYGKDSITISVMALDFMIPYFQNTFTVIAFISRNFSTLDSGCNRKGLCNRTGFIGIGDAEILPQSIQMQILI